MVRWPASQSACGTRCTHWRGTRVGQVDFRERPHRGQLPALLQNL